MAGQPYRLSATIPSAGSTGSAIDLGNHRIVGILMPDAWDHADLGFIAGVITGGFETIPATFREVRDDKFSGVSLQVTASAYIAVDSGAMWFAALPRFVQPISLSAAAFGGSAQLDDRTLWFSLKGP